MTTGANFEPPCGGNIVSEHIEELNSDGDCFANCHEMSDPGRKNYAALFLILLKIYDIFYNFLFCVQNSCVSI